MNESLISVIIPVYNAEKFIDRCISSILNNTYSNFELICVNDGSKDNSLAILNQYKSKDSRVIVLSQDNSGVSAARNAGLKTAKGKYISFVDADDWVHPQYLEHLFSAIDNSDISHCEMKRVNTIHSMNKEALSTVEVLNTDNQAIKRLTDHCWGKLFKVECIQNLFLKSNLLLAKINCLPRLQFKPQRSVCNIKSIEFFFDNPNSVVNTIEHDLYQPAMFFSKMQRKINMN